LIIFNKLSDQNKALIAQFTDVNANSTLARFLDDCDDAFLTLINKSENTKFVEGFVTHKTDGEIDDIVGLIADLSSQGDDITKVTKWLERSENAIKFGQRRQAGIAFGDLMKTELANSTSDAFQKLRSHLETKGIDIDDYSIYSQVELCIKGDCSSKGNYWKPDFMLVAERNGPEGVYLETIIVDAKLTRNSGWTPNQRGCKESYEPSKKATR